MTAALLTAEQAERFVQVLALLHANKARGYLLQPTPKGIVTIRLHKTGRIVMTLNTDKLYAGESYFNIKQLKEAYNV